MSKHDGAKLWPQRFPEKAVLQWKTLLKESSELTSCVECWDASSINGQLAAMKKIAASIQKSSLQCTLSPNLVQILVNMHLHCASRHPLQRSISSILQDLPLSYDHLVSTLTSEALKNTLNGIVLDMLSKQLQYIQSLMENFLLGETVLLNSLPLLLQFFDYQFEVTSNGGSAMYDDMILLMKTLTNFLHKCSKLEDLSISSSLLWPPALQEQLVTEKVVWIETKLNSLQIKAENMLFSDAVSHDVVLSAGMLCTVLLVLIASSSTNSVEAIRSKVQSWLCQQNIVLFTRLALCHSFLAKIPCIHLLDVMMDETSLLLALFPIICNLFGSITETPDRYLAARTLALWTSVAKECSTANISLTEALHPDGKIMSDLLQFVWTLWEDPVNGIRHQCQSIFMDIIATYKVLDSSTSEKYLLSLLECLLHMKNSTRGKYTLLTLLSRHINVHDILRLNPGLPQELMEAMGHQALACHAGELWSQLVKLHWSVSVTCENWQKIWIETLVMALSSKSTLARQHIIQHCLVSVFECDEHCLSHIEECLTHLEGSEESKMTTLLTCLRVAKTACKDFKIEEKFSAVLLTAMHHGDEQVQLSMLGLICESRRTTELPHPAALSLVLQFLHLNGSTQSTGFRYDIVTCIRKLLRRIRDGWYALLKLSENEHELQTYKGFLKNLMIQQFQALQPLSAFQRREISLLILNVMQETFTYDSVQTPSKMFVFTEAVTIPCLHCLVFTLLDSYSANKSAALNIVLKFPKAHVTLQDDTFKMFVERFFELVRSPKATDCSSAAYLLKCFNFHDGSRFNSLLLEIVCNHRKLDKRMQLTITDESSISIIRILLEILQWQLVEAETSLIKASISAPMYGVIQSIHAALENIDLSCRSIGGESCKFKPTMHLLLQICQKISNLVSPVVCNSSPEGFLPSHQQSLETFFIDSSFGNAQSLLLCCWHCMKEISLLFGYIVETASLGDGQILDVEELSSIGDIFVQQLTEARHRGAFEMAFNGFTKLCQRLWSCPFSELKAKTSRWIDEILTSLQSNSITKLLNITRRSAGLPFYIQAILVTEPKHSGFECFHTAMEVLLTIAENWSMHQSLPLEENLGIEVEPSAVHALNILRALYRDSILGQRILPYIPRGLMIAIDGFSSSFWPIRNSSTMLLSAVVTRIFGVKKVQDERSPENKTTAKEFFTRFPTLRKFILMKLEDAVTAISDSQSMLQPSLFAILLILSRLYPSPVDNKDAVEYMESFLPPLLSCTKSPVWKTRDLVSYAILSTVPTSKWTHVVLQVVESLSAVNQNHIHGLLLVLQRLFFDHPEGSTVLNDRHTVALILNRLLAVRNLGLWENNCLITQSLYVEIITGLLRLIPRGFDLEQNAPSVQLFVLKALPVLSQGYNRAMFRAGMQAAISELLMLFASNASGWKIAEFPAYDQLLMELCNHSEAEIRKYGIDMLRSLPTERAAYIESIVLPLLCSENNEDVLTKLCWTAAYTKSLRNIVLQHQGLCRALEIVQSACRIELKLALMKFISNAISVANISQEAKFGWMEILQKMSSESCPVELRHAVAQVLKNQWTLVKNDCSLMQQYWLLTLTLLQDPVESVRNEMAKSISFALSKEMTLYPGYGANPCPPAALKWTVQAMVQLHQPEPNPNVEILATLVNYIPDKTKTPSPTLQLILFDEDPVNTFAEQWVLFEIIIASLSCAEHPSQELKYHLESLIETSQSYVKYNTQVEYNSKFPFTNTTAFLLLLKSIMVLHMCGKELTIPNYKLENMHPLIQRYVE